MSNVEAKLDTHDLRQVMIAFRKIDEVTDILDAHYGDDWGKGLNPLGDAWRDLYDVIEHHVGEDNVYASIGLVEVDDEI